MATKTLRKRIEDSKLRDMVQSYRFALTDARRVSFWGQIIAEVEQITEQECAARAVKNK